MMRVLWFLDSEPPAVRRRLGTGLLNEVGWQGSLAEVLRESESIELTIACRAAEPFPPFEEEGIRYVEVGASHPRSGSERVVERWRTLSRPSVNLAKCHALIDETGAQVVHVHGTENPFGLICESSCVPVVISIQGLLTACRLLDKRGVDAHLLRSLSPLLFLRGSGFLFERLELRAWAPRERYIIGMARHIVGRTRFDADIVRLLNPDADYYHCDEVLRPPFWLADWTADAAVPGRLLTTVRGYARKGVGTLLEAVALLRNARPSLGADIAVRNAERLHLRIAGDFVNSESQRAVQRAILALGIERAVTLLGSLNAIDLADELAKSSVFVLPSHVDNSPNSLAEAMLVGTPCVATSAGGIPSMTRDGVEALLVQDGDPYALGGAVNRLLSQPDLALALARQARGRARRRHDPDIVRSRLLDIYEKVAESQQRHLAPQLGK